MSLLDELESSAPQAPMITIVGFPGAGKTSLAGLFPKSIFIQAENAKTVFESVEGDNKPAFLKHLPAPSKANQVHTSKEVMSKLRMILQEEHDYQTLVVDSITSLNALFEQEVVEFDDPNNGKKTESIGNAAGGYHKGYDVSMGMHANVVRACEYIRSKRNMTIVFLAHTGLNKVKNQPDETSEYSTYSLAMHERSRKIYIDKSDAVIYIKKEQFVMGGEQDKKGNQTKSARVTTTGDRILITSSDGTVGYVDAKTRYKMPQEIKFTEGENPLLPYIPFFNQTNNQ